MQRILTIENFKQVLPSQAVVFETAEEFQRNNGRVIRLRVNTPEGASLYVAPHPERFDSESGELVRYFLGFVKPGFDEIEFTVTGDFSLQTSAEIWLATYEGSQFVVEPADYESWARVLERPEEDPRVAQYRRLEKLLLREREQQRMLDRLEIESRIAAMEERYKANVDPPSTAAATATQGRTAGGAPMGTQSAQQSGDPAAAGTGGEPNGGN